MRRLWPAAILLPAVCLILLLSSTRPALAKEEKGTCAMGREYFLYLPDQIDPKKTYWLVVGAHALGGSGKGAAGLEGWVRKGNCIVLGPSFPDTFQFLSKNTDKQLVDLFKVLQKKYHLHPKLFIYGFSAGSQYAHRFAMEYPELVVGCAAHSGGTWGDVKPKARSVLFAISCGEADTAKSYGGAPLGRLDWAKKFASQLEAGRFCFKARFWPGVGHGGSAGSSQLTEECFCLATTGLDVEQYKLLTTEVDQIRTLIKAEDFGNAAARLLLLSQYKLPKAAKPDDKPGKGEAAKPVDKPGKGENEYGWHENPASKAVLAARLKETFVEQARPLASELQKAGLDKVAAIEKDQPADAVAQLEKLQDQFKDVKSVSAAVARALGAVKKQQ